MRRAGWQVGGLVVVGLMLGPAAFAADPHVRFKVQEPFRVGSHTYDAGVISLQAISTYTPSTSILEVWVNNECLGMMTAHRSASEAPPQRTEALFERAGDGRLEMSGFRVTGGVTDSTYRFPTAASTSTSAQAIALAYASN